MNNVLGRDVVEEISKTVSRRGATTKSKNGVLEIIVPDEPIYIEVYPTGDTIVVEMKVGEGLRERVDEYLDHGEDPREALEEVLETLVSIVDEIDRILRLHGFKVERKTREAILDVYDELESRVEEV